MTIQETIIEALKSVQVAHSGALNTIAKLHTEKAALEAEVARLRSHVARLKTDIAHLESESIKIVEPEAVRSLLASLAQVVSEGQRVGLPTQGSQASSAEFRNWIEAPLVDPVRPQEAHVNGVKGPAQFLRKVAPREQEAMPNESADVIN